MKHEREKQEDPGARYQVDGALRDELARWADERWRDWAYYATITFRRTPRDAIAASSAVLRSLRRVGGLHRPRRVLYGVENGRRGTPHMHALWGRALVEHDWRWWKEWAFDRFGISRFYPYERDRGATAYVTKYIYKESAAQGTWGLWTFAELFEEKRHGQG